METSNIETFNSVNFIFAKPAYEGHYYYALDDIKQTQIIDKDSLRELLVKLKCYDFIKTNYLLEHNFPLFYDVKNKQWLEFEETNGNISTKDIKEYLYEELKLNNTQKQQTPYEYFFGKNSNFYKNNIYQISEENQWL